MGIQKVEPLHAVDSTKCECALNLGVFFDGTGNNYEHDRPRFAHTNITRLFDAYLKEPDRGYYRLYVPGVGTPFPEIGEVGESGLGAGFAIGCESRVLYGLCFVLNCLHRAAFGGPLLSETQVRLLCCTKAEPSFMKREDLDVLLDMGLTGGLRMPDTFGDGNRDKILRQFSRLLEAKLKNGRPKIKECFIDVFGFSRGAAQARVFCNWLDRVLVNETFAGVRLHFRFLGIMDTVASAGFWSSMTGGITGGDGGHSGWADAEYLLIPASVKNCVHLVAMHELRRNFPLDTVTVDGVLPSNCQEYAYPGVHSDIGGGYAPGELGAIGHENILIADAFKLSQIPLVDMLFCGIAAGAPLNVDRAGDGVYNPFTVHPRVREAFEEFMNHNGTNPRPLNKWLQPYLNWRWRIREKFADQEYVKRAVPKDRTLLLKYNEYLMRDAKLIRYYSRAGWIRRWVDPTMHIVGKAARRLDDEASEVLHAAMHANPVDKATDLLFSDFVHDSLAGFNLESVEWTGYWRYRKGFLGNRHALIAEAAVMEDERQIA